MTKYTLTESELVKLVQKIINEQTLNDLDEYELVELLKMEDQRAQTKFFNRYYNRLKGYIRSKSQKFDEDDIDTIVSQSLIKALNSIDDYRGDTNLDAWIAFRARRAEVQRSSAEVPTRISESNSCPR